VCRSAACGNSAGQGRNAIGVHQPKKRFALAILSPQKVQTGDTKPYEQPVRAGELMKTKLSAASAAVLIAGVLTGCANVPDKNTPVATTYGTYPNDYKTLIDAYQQTTLKEPSSAVVQYLNEPSSGWTQAAAGTVFGYRVCLIVNAKNSYNGNVGNLLTEVFIRDEKVVSYLVADHSSSAYDAAVQSACDSVSPK
jgi:hypothetical protein